ncbi:MAG: dTDP-4-dehydrorhamnose reductase [Deltaproteobacteria bacterium RBG_13_52_11b]|nr:MAG: dTDP-4-dehydrorhamnose reductase [Deltaproteobacteria bacterium RBG_13_52_11b]
MKRILVIGAKGMLGRDLVEVLRASSSDEVTGWDIDEVDIRIEMDTVTKISRLGPEIVINLAAFTNVDECESQVERAFAVNAEGMRHVALGALRCRAKVVYVSTDYVFDGEKGEPYVENDSPNPLNVYGRSKFQGERYVQQLTEDGLIVRTQWLFGKHGNNFVTFILRQAREKKELSIVDNQRGSPTYTVDLAKAISALVQHDAKGIFHVANSETCTWFAFGQSILESSGMAGVSIRPISSKELNRPAIRPPYSGLNCQKLKQVTGMTLRPWSEALREYVHSLRE